MENAELVFIATPLMGHLISQIEFATHIVSRNPRISISILIPMLPVPDLQISSYLQSLPSINQISILELPPLDNLPPDCPKRFSLLLDLLSHLYIPFVKSFVEQRRRITHFAGIVVDMFCVPIIDVAEELGVPSYVFFPSGAVLLSLMLQLESVGVDSVYSLPESTTLELAGFRNPVPLKVWPVTLLSKEASAQIMRNVGRYRATNGVLVNTFTDLESDLLRSFSENKRNPPIYSIGPVLHLGHRIKDDINGRNLILRWLDAQPSKSVVFLCFGSIGSFGKEQVEQIAAGIESSGKRFLWCLRRQPKSGEAAQMPTDYEDFNEVLPEGFLERTAGVGKVIGWAPQVEVLAHASVGAFVSHCGWNSVLESLWFGVPVVTWPMYAEQQLNAFLLVRELGIAVELTAEYLYDFTKMEANVVVSAAEVERGLRRMMEEEEGVVVRKKVKEMSELARKAVEIDGSSSESLRRFAEEVIANCSKFPS